MLFTPPISEQDPIRINEFWLLNLGFKPSNGHEYSIWIDEWECKSLFVEDRYCGIRIGNQDILTIGYIKYVHQLQMLYYSLTNRELTITTIPN
jgi:hypothetical protein